MPLELGITGTALVIALTNKSYMAIMLEGRNGIKFISILCYDETGKSPRHIVVMTQVIA